MILGGERRLSRFRTPGACKTVEKTGHSYGAVNPFPGWEKYQDGVDLA